ncbi:hypothetical protein B296_00038483 [Ensete ventricosum]|uniref:Uncharacterized protein n=1 Tax=Ensete ventricosum TaxID=4639 RepID=A0A426ZW96_ENSVE|nr:hypothetical protein B296_00038483 [Ensete ventricosum]
MTSSDSSTNASVVPSAGSGGTSLVEPEASSSGVSFGPSSSVDARVLRDLEVMKAGHDLDTTVTEGSLTAIRERYNIPVEYGLHVVLPGQRPYSSDAPRVAGEVGAANEFDQDLGRLEVRRGVRKGTSTSVVGEGVVHAPIRGAPCPSCQGDGPARGDFSDARRELKEAWVKAHRVDDDDLLKSVKELERV